MIRLTSAEQLSKSLAKGLPPIIWIATDEPLLAMEAADLARAKARPGCTCTKKTRLLPEPPCDAFYGRPPPGARRRAQQLSIERAWNTYRATYQKKVGIPSGQKVERELTIKLGRTPSVAEVRKERQVNHLTPKAAGGCPTGDKSRFDNTNLQAHGQLCPACRDIDAAFGEFQS